MGLNYAEWRRSRGVDNEIPPSTSTESDKQKGESPDSEFVWVRYSADQAPHDGIEYVSAVHGPEVVARERLAREEAERRLEGVLDLVAERHARKRRPAPAPVPVSEVGEPEVDDTIRARARKALRRGGFALKKP